MWVNNLPKVAAQWNSGATRDSNPGHRARIPSALTTRPLSHTKPTFYNGLVHLHFFRQTFLRLITKKRFFVTVSASLTPDFMLLQFDPMIQCYIDIIGTVCRSQYGHRRHCKFFAADWRPSFLPGRTAALTKSVSLHWLPRDFTVIPTCYVSLQS